MRHTNFFIHLNKSLGWLSEIMSAYISRPDRMGIPNKTELFFPGLIHYNIPPSKEYCHVYRKTLAPLGVKKPCCQPASQRQFHKQAKKKRARIDRRCSVRCALAPLLLSIDALRANMSILVLVFYYYWPAVFVEEFSISQSTSQGLPERCGEARRRRMNPAIKIDSTHGVWVVLEMVFGNFFWMIYLFFICLYLILSANQKHEWFFYPAGFKEFSFYLRKL